ncbi:MAG TPA: hypothetical protein VKT72_13260 [Candidatus Baltobacteraceae bacterium]|nr:hypothetical protein [Candidatus Baltobacteraceae bacterium]
MNRLAYFFISLAAAGAVTAGTALAAGAPIRHLVYNFDVSISTTSNVQSAVTTGEPMTGSTNFQAGTGDRGQITVDVLSVQPDTGLVVQISEKTTSGARNADPTMCVVYGNTEIICDQSKGQLYQEELALLRLLGHGFINPATIDAKNHWHYGTNNPQSQETDDFTLGKANGDLVPVTYQRVLKVTGGSGFDSTTDGSISYNQKLNVPISISENTSMRKQAGIGTYNTTQQKITLSLASDSMQTAQNH